MSEKALLFIHALTGLHPGSGTALGVVDLPVQRERHTQWPLIPASSLKGVLRDACRRRIQGEPAKSDTDPSLTAVFGPPTDNAHEHAGALSLTDARVLAFPVRSVYGVFAWITSPAVLARFRRDLKLSGLDDIGDVPSPEKGKIACIAGPLLVDGKNVVLEEFDFERTGDPGGLADWISGNKVIDEDTAKRMKDHLAVLSDDDFSYFVRHATEVVARIGLHYETKTVKTGALFYEEFLPAETLFYSMVIAETSRKPKERESDRMEAWDVLRYVRETIPAELQVGGDETIGKGLCAVRFVTGGGAK